MEDAAAVATRVPPGVRRPVSGPDPLLHLRDRRPRARDPARDAYRARALSDADHLLVVGPRRPRDHDDPAQHGPAEWLLASRRTVHVGRRATSEPEGSRPPEVDPRERGSSDELTATTRDGVSPRPRPRRAPGART